MKATQEAVICLFDDGGKLSCIVRKNGEAKHFKTEEMGYNDLAEMYGAITGPSAD